MRIIIFMMATFYLAKQNLESFSFSFVSFSKELILSLSLLFSFSFERFLSLLCDGMNKRGLRRKVRRQNGSKSEGSKKGMILSRHDPDLAFGETELQFNFSFR